MLLPFDQIINLTLLRRRRSLHIAGNREELLKFHFHEY